MGIGIADGVGGWQAYGIDSSSFSDSLMEACKTIWDKKLEILLSSDSFTPIFNRDLYFSESWFDRENISNKEQTEINITCGVTFRNHKLKRIQSSFHLSEDFIQKCNDQSSTNAAEFCAPQSGFTTKEKSKRRSLRS